ncbi:MAG: ABC transporter ATP-binding protein/permease [Pelagibacteraceae bacterium]|nr:ABC transporter ATP-binding protein/permease [Pelagibacteraceae bacterium]MBT5213661.1 ABC transporter ATP-binding protein/permease [Pelagibacteraceae bacterium]MBT6354206.1 ABC transporter ATP-binding protein/permease [Pelagibacteraceae bacterium]
MSNNSVLIKTSKLLFPFLWPKNRKDLKIRVLLALFSMILAKIASVYTPLILGDAVDSLTNLSSGLNLLLYIPIALIISYGVVRIASFAFGEIRDALFSKVSQNAIRRVSLKIFKHLHYLSLDFHLSRQTGGLNRYIDRGTKGIDFLLRYVLFNVVPTFIELMLVIGILFALYGYEYALITLVTITIYIVLTFTITQWRIQFRKDMNKADNDASTKMIDSLLNFETVKYFNNEKHEFNRLDESLEKYEYSANKNRMSLSLLNVSQTLVIMTGITIMLTLSVFGIKNNTISVGGFVVINAYMLQLYQPLNFLGTIYREIRQSLIDMENMFNLLNEKNTVEDNGLNKIAINNSEISFKNISFGYHSNRPIINNISFDLKKGKSLAIVGPTGAGKSTISKLLFRFYDPSNGEILINSKNIKNYKQESLRQIIGIVPQDTVLFNDTIYYNISYGKPGSTREEIINAAKIAGIHNFIESIPEQYNTIVGERGLKLSGGEKQRVAIARTVLKNPSIFFFDEATSALDSSTEKEIIQNLEKISEGKTTLIIAHRLSTVSKADNIIVIDQGNIVESGNHQNLLDKNGLYADMWSKQKHLS